MPRRFFAATLSLAFLAAVPAARAENLEEAEAKIAAALGKHKAVVIKMKFSQDIKTDDFAMKSEGESTAEYKRAGEKGYMSRVEAKSKDVRTLKGQDAQKSNTHSLLIVDGKYNYILTESGDMKTAMKQKLDPKKNLNPFDIASLFKEQDKSFTLKLLPDEKVDGKDCWVIEAKPKDEKASLITARTVSCYCKKTGVSLKSTSYDSTGKQTVSSVVTDMKINPDLADERFTFTAPDGVQVVDMDAAQKSQQSDTSEPKTESPKTEAKPTEEKKSADAAPEPKPEPKKEEKKSGLGGLLNKIVK